MIAGVTNGSIDSAIGLFCFGLSPLTMTQSRPTKDQSAAGQMEAGNTTLTVNGRHVAPAFVDAVDNGRGIPRKARNRLVHPFLTTKREGIGLWSAKAVRGGKISS